LTKTATLELDDQELVTAYLETQKSIYFDVLYQRYSPKVYGKCLSLIKESNLAKDLTQDIFMKILMNLSKFQGKAKFSTWIYSITYNYCIDYIRKQKNKYKSELDDDKFVEDSSKDDIDDKLLLEVKIEQLTEVLDKIPVEDKAVLLMKYKESMSIKQICGILDKSESAVKMKIKRAKAKFVKVHNSIF
jgi:RNA polymerase sigma-70 factor (ECF subfamily)